MRHLARDAGATPVIPCSRNYKRVIRYDKPCYAGRHLIEKAFCRLEDFRRVYPYVAFQRCCASSEPFGRSARYDKLAANFLSAVALAIAVAFWL